MQSVSSPVYAEIYRFLVSAPTPAEIIAFHASEDTQARVRHLLDANRLGQLSPEEHGELDEFERANHFVSMLKIFAHKQLAGRE